MKTYSLDYDDPNAAAKVTLQIFIDQLTELRSTTSKPAELEWEIRVYHFILEDPVKRLTAYQNARRRGDGLKPYSKRDAVAKLGWVIP
jgi:hypothetical protein